MWRWRLAVRALHVAALVVLLGPDGADACTCMNDADGSRAQSAADAVFVGTVIDQRAYLELESAARTGPAVMYDVVVHRAWKGVADAHLTLRMGGGCAPSLGVGVPSLIYAGERDGRLFIMGCTPTGPVDAVGDFLSRLGAAAVTFAEPAEPVAGSLPFSRRVRALVVGGAGVYAYRYRNREWEPLPWDMVLAPVAALLLAVAAAIVLIRRRWRLAAGLLAASVLTLAAAILWTGHELLQGDWAYVFLRW